MMRPVFLFGSGLRGNQELIDYLCGLGIPVLTTWQGTDLISEDSPVFCGRPGILGQRAANIIQQKSTWFMAIGARLDPEQVGHDYDNFAPRAVKTVIDIDETEFNKYPASWRCAKIDLHETKNIKGLPSGNAEWLAECKNLYARFRPELEGNDDDPNHVNLYSFINALSNIVGEKDILVPGSSGQQSCAFMQAFRVSKGQRILLCNSIGSMGMEPMAIGAKIAANRRVIIISGDGGFFQNVQELEIVRRLALPLHYLICDNGGYSSIATMQDIRFGRRVGSDPASGLTLPELSATARMWNIPYFGIRNNSELSKLADIISLPFATITAIHTSLEFSPANKVMSRIIVGRMLPDAMEDVTPKLPCNELKELMK
jgi:acetolactate synthase-1/2/3 large subunit